jgi:glucokinase
MIAAAAAVAFGAATYYLMTSSKMPAKKQPSPPLSPKTPTAIRKERDTPVALLGDVGGTNIRLCLKRLNLKNRTSEEIKGLQSLPSQSYNSFYHAVEDFLKEFEGTENWPTVGVVGIAGEVTNNTVITTNCPHWPISDGKQIAE